MVPPLSMQILCAVVLSLPGGKYRFKAFAMKCSLDVMKCFVEHGSIARLCSMKQRLLFPHAGQAGGGQDAVLYLPGYLIGNAVIPPERLCSPGLNRSWFCDRLGKTAARGGEREADDAG